MVLQLIAQTRTISGKVVDSAGAAMAGVTVSVKGNTKVHSITDGVGQFKLALPANAQFLIFTFVGFRDTTVSIIGKESISIIMEGAESQLGEVVVTGFQRIDKAKFGGAAVSLKADAVRTDGMTDVSRMLEGKVAGVAVQNPSGTFGTAPRYV
jgi:hypothetical protein